MYTYNNNITSKPYINLKELRINSLILIKWGQRTINDVEWKKIICVHYIYI